MTFDLFLTIYLWGLIPCGALAIYRLFFTVIFMNEVLWVIVALALWPATIVVAILEWINE